MMNLCSKPLNCMRHLKLIMLTVISCLSMQVYSQNYTIPGAITTPYPTFRNLAVEWNIQGDDNLNGSVTVWFREGGEKSWHQGMSLFRVPAGHNLQFKWENKHSGSIFDLSPLPKVRNNDAALLIPNMNDQFTGKAPDIGAYESGQALPLYGPRHEQLSDQYRPALFFREDWKEIPAATPVTQYHVSNKDLLLNLYGPGADSIRKSHHTQPADDPYYIWSGLCLGNWAVTLKSKTSFADLRDYAKIIWRSKQAGLHCLHIIIKLANDTWLVSDQCDGQLKDWRIHEFNLADINWHELDIGTVVEGVSVPNPDLSKVDEVGFTDLMRGGESDACSRLDWIEVYGKAVNR